MTPGHETKKYDWKFDLKQRLLIPIKQFKPYSNHWPVIWLSCATTVGYILWHKALLLLHFRKLTLSRTPHLIPMESKMVSTSLCTFFWCHTLILASYISYSFYPNHSLSLDISTLITGLNAWICTYRYSVLHPHDEVDSEH